MIGCILWNTFDYIRQDVDMKSDSPIIPKYYSLDWGCWELCVRKAFYSPLLG